MTTNTNEIEAAKTGWHCTNCQTVFTASASECKSSVHHDPSPNCPYCKAWNQYTYPYRLHQGNPCTGCGKPHDEVEAGQCPAASSRGVADGIERELARLPKGVSWSIGQMMGLPEQLRYRCFLSDHNTEDGKATRHLDCDKASPVEAIRAAIAEAESAWGYVSAPLSPAATPEVERDSLIEVLKRIDDGVFASLDDRADAILSLFRTPPAPAGRGGE